LLQSACWPTVRRRVAAPTGFRAAGRKSGAPVQAPSYRRIAMSADVIDLAARRRSPLFEHRSPNSIAEAQCFRLDLDINELVSVHEDGWWWHSGPDAWQFDLPDGSWRFYEQEGLLLYAGPLGRRSPRSVFAAPPRRIDLCAAVHRLARAGMTVSPDEVLMQGAWHDCRRMRDLLAALEAGATAFSAGSSWRGDAGALYELHANGRATVTAGEDTDASVSAAFLVAAVAYGASYGEC
jgi:hypothetical protein